MEVKGRTYANILIFTEVGENRSAKIWVSIFVFAFNLLYLSRLSEIASSFYLSNNLKRFLGSALTSVGEYTLYESAKSTGATQLTVAFVS